MFDVEYLAHFKEFSLGARVLRYLDYCSHKRRLMWTLQEEGRYGPWARV